MTFRLLTLAVAAWAVPLGAASLVSHEMRQNRAEMKLSDGVAVLEWISDSTFRFCRTWDPNRPCGVPRNKEDVQFRTSETADALEFRTEYLIVRVAKNGPRITVRRVLNNALLFEEPEPLARNPSTVTHQAGIAAGDAFYGLNATLDRGIDLRGRIVTTNRPFLASSAGYGLFYTVPGDYSFNLGAADARRWRVEVPGSIADYLFYYGPKLKSIYEEHGSLYPVSGGDAQFESESEWLPRYATALPAAKTACEAVAALLSASLSGFPVPALDVSSFSPAEARRFRELAPLVPFLYRFPKQSPAGQAILRQRELLRPYFVTYLQEARDRGFPMIHPLPMQFPEDESANGIADEFLLGDELLLAPVCNGAATREVYLPRGVWTDLRTGLELRGRQKVSVDGATLPMFGRNGTILPLLSATEPGLLKLHYFPKLGAEFFLTEPDLEDISQFHASPALDFLRLEIESKKDRTYEWIVHHWVPIQTVQHNGVAYPAAANLKDLKPGQWFYDSEKRNLHIRLKAPAGGDDIVNVTF